MAKTIRAIDPFMNPFPEPSTGGSGTVILPRQPGHLWYKINTADQGGARAWAALYRWHDERTAKSGEIEAFLTRKFDRRLFDPAPALTRLQQKHGGVLGAVFGALAHLTETHCPLYITGEEGQLEKVLYNGKTPRGWTGIPGSHWMEPIESESIAEVNRLPRVPPYAQLHEIFNWPTVPRSYVAEADRELVDRLNRLIVIYEDRTGLYLKLPRIEDFRETNPARIYNTLKTWKKPDWLVPVHQIKAPAPSIEV